MKKQRGEIATVIMAALLGACFTALAITTPDCEAEPGHEQCTLISQ